LTFIFNSSRKSHPSEAVRPRAGFFVWRFIGPNAPIATGGGSHAVSERRKW
jgi:hypothetical protein